MNVSLAKVQTTIRLPSELKKELEKQAQEKGISFNAYVLIALDEYINRQK